MGAPFLLRAFGYDPVLLGKLTHADRQRLGAVAGGWLFSLSLLAWPAAYTLWLVEHSLWLSAGVGVATFLLLLNLLRVVTAGGGLHPEAPRTSAAHYRPGLAPATLLCLLAALFAQPAQLPLQAAELDPLVSAYREELIEAHRVRLGAAADGRSFEHYRSELRSCDFVVRRLALLWREPSRQARFTALYCLLVLLPALFRQFVALDAVRAYELARYRSVRQRVASRAQRTASEVAAALRRFPSYVRDSARPSTLPDALQAASRSRRQQLSLRFRAAP